MSDLISIRPIVLCGGSGTRLWPLSRKSFPKQFVPLVGNRSLLEATLLRVAALGGRVSCVGADEHRFMIAEAIAAAGCEGDVILEPAARNTAAAMALAALAAESMDLLLFCPADHHIPDAAAFADMVRGGAPAARAGALVTFGVMPTFPSTAYGYIVQGAMRPDGARQVARFVEKPRAEAAEALLLQNDALWNAGIFLARADVLIAALGAHAPDILESCRAAMHEARREIYGEGGANCTFLRPGRAAFEACRSESIDYAVLEKHPDVAVLPFAGRWSDVGSWNAVADLTAADPAGNRTEGHALAIGAINTFVHSPHRLAVALGTKDLLIVDTPDALLVADRGHAESVKSVVVELEANQRPQAALHRRVARPWGDFDSIDEGARFKVKRITVKPGASLSLQLHHYRAEHWIVVQGVAEVTRGDETFVLTENQSTYIPIGEKHRLRNPGTTPLAMIEVQSGSYLGEDDIVRFEDNYGR